MSILIIGGTGTIGRQIVRYALNEGYNVKCIVRNLRKAFFLQELGAELIYGDLDIPETIPNILKNCNVIIDSSTTRANEVLNMKKIDWDGKISLLQAAKIVKIDRFIFFSLANVERYPLIPLMKLKLKYENILKNSEIPYTIFRTTGFFQGLISQYALPILEKQSIWINRSNTLPIAYIDTNDIAQFCLRSLTLEQTKNKIFLLGGAEEWYSLELIVKCEKFSGQKAKLIQTPQIFIKLTRICINFFEWGWNIADRLAFIELPEDKFLVQFNKLNYIFKFKPINLSYLDIYLEEYFEQLLIKLKYLNYNNSTESKRKDIIF
jgi:uncharacterized protein YbjT (DUF2867 family)